MEITISYPKHPVWYHRHPLYYPVLDPQVQYIIIYNTHLYIGKSQNPTPT